MLGLVFLLVITILGFSVYLVCNQKQSTLTITYQTAIEIVTGGLLIISIVSIVLLEWGKFNISHMILIAISIAVILGFCVRSVPKICFDFHLNKCSLGLILILVLASFFRFPPWNWIRGGQDQGLYINIANHIRKTGEIFITDPILKKIQHKDPIMEYYLRNNYQEVWGEGIPALAEKYEGDYAPGLYLKDVSKGKIVPQFYHLHPIWLAISNYILGVQYSAFSLYLFSLLSVILIYFITRSLIGSDIAALISALLLAVNPVHSYMSKLPVSEVTAGLFFLAGIYFIFRLFDSDSSDLFSGVNAAISFGCFFFTRITGFLFLPLILFFLFAANISRKKDKRMKIAIFTLMAILYSYLWSFIHGYLFSFPYARYIYQKYLGFKLEDLTDLSTWLLILVSLLLLFVLYCVIKKYAVQIKSIIDITTPQRSYIIAAIMFGVFILIAYRGYLYAFTDYFFNPLYTDPGGGFKVIPRLNISVLAIILTPWGLLLSFFGIYRMLHEGFDHTKYMVIGLSGLYFLSVYTIIKIISPHLYYWSRYLISELIPLLILCLSFALFWLYKNHFKTFIAILLSILLPSMFLSYLHTKDVEMKDTFKDLETIASVFDDNAIMFIDSKIQPSPNLLIPPFRLTFDRSVFLFNQEDLQSAKFEEILSYWVTKGHNIYLLSNKERLNSEYFVFDRKLPIRLNEMSVTRFTVPVDFQQNQKEMVYIFRQSKNVLKLIKNCVEVEELSADGLHARINLAGTDDIRLNKGQILQIPITVMNISKEVWSSQGDCLVNLAYHWLGKSEQMLLFDGIRSLLPHDVYPGEKVEVQATVRALENTGKNILEFDLVQENVSWFKENGSKTLKVNIDIK